MKLTEAFYVGAIPWATQKHLWRYVCKKLLGLNILTEEKEANILLRILAKSKGSIYEISSREIILKIPIAETSIDVVARRYPSSDLGILFQVLGKKEYQPAIDILNKKGEQNNELRILDAGANVGYASLFFAANFPNAKILSIEMDENNFIQIRRNLALNNFESIIPIQKAIWKREALLEIKMDFRDKTECSYYAEESELSTGLKGFSIDYFMKEQGWSFIDLLKIDIEGSERYLFESEELANLLLAKTNLLAIEIHDEFGIRPMIYDHFTKNNFHYFEHGDLSVAYRVLIHIPIYESLWFFICS